MNQLSCVIVDDEPRAIELLKDYVAQVPFLSLNSTFRDPVEALLKIKTEDIDLVFLDINMPNLTGVQLKQSLTDSTMVVFCTAYADFAVKSYELNAVDYLLKPINFDRFVKAAIKAYDQSQKKGNGGVFITENDGSPKTKERDTFFVKTGFTLTQVAIGNISVIEGMGNYVTIFLVDDGKEVALSSLKDMESELSRQNFIRVHKSYIVNLKHVLRVSSSHVELRNFQKKIPIGSSYRSAVLQLISEK